MTDGERKTAPYGSWKSPITSALIAAQSIVLSEVRLDGGNVYWLEGRPEERGRCVVVCGGSGGSDVDITPAPFNVRSRVHEYGGGAWTVVDGILYFSNLVDGRLYRQRRTESAPQPLTPAAGAAGSDWRFADGCIDRDRNRWIGVREDHTAGGEPINTIVAVDLANSHGPGHILASGHDFYSSTRLSPDGCRLIFLAWDHPNMPWNGTVLYLAGVAEDGALDAIHVIAGGVAESIFQPEWSPDGKSIVYISDRSGWWNLYHFELGTRTAQPLAPRAAEFGKPQWALGMSTYAFASNNRIICAHSTNGLEQLAVLDLHNGDWRPIATCFTNFSSVRVDGDRAVFCAGAPDYPSCIVALDLQSGHHAVMKKATELLNLEKPRISEYLSRPESVEFPTTGGKTAFGLFYPPQNQDYAPALGEKPPLLVRCHGGPTLSTSSTLNLTIQYWTSRGIAVLDVNYGGSTGFGRAYRDRLHQAWGIVDVDDCENGAKFLAEQGRVDGQRCVISGPSAGGYTTLLALIFRDFFQGGACYYGVLDVAAFGRETHKFESRYLDWLIGPYPQEKARYHARSPMQHADRLSKPVIFFQGDEDAIVPPRQTEAMVERLRRNSNPIGYFLFSGEQHGFRNGVNIRHCLDAELYFYAINVFGIGLAF
jgi:dipeptidyl aminopeptidase/acylaminoacyl peptidase